MIFHRSAKASERADAGLLGAVPRACRAVERARIAREAWFDSPEGAVGDPDRDVRGRVRSGSVVASMANANIPFRRVIPDRPRARSGRRRAGRRRGMETNPTTGVQVGEMSGAGKVSEARRPRRRGRRSRADGAMAKQDAVVTRSSRVAGGGVRRGVRGVRGDVGAPTDADNEGSSRRWRWSARKRGDACIRRSPPLMLREGNELDAATSRGNARAGAGSSDGARGASKRRALGVRCLKAKKRESYGRVMAGRPVELETPRTRRGASLARSRGAGLVDPCAFVSPRPAID